VIEDPSSNRLYDAIQYHYGKLIGEIGYHVKFLKVVSQASPKLLDLNGPLLARFSIECRASMAASWT
jgi:hypothetical protein